MSALGKDNDPEPDWSSESDLSNSEVERLRNEFIRGVGDLSPSRSREQFHERGVEISDWIEDPTHPNCPIPVSILTIAQISERTRDERRYVMDSHELVEQSLELPPGFDPQSWVLWAGRVVHTTLEAYFGHGIIVINVMNRPKLSTGPHISGLAATLYAQEHPIESLRHVIISTIVNREFHKYLDFLELDDNELEVGIQFDWGSPKYFEFMGTRVGRVVGSIVLAAFPRGSRRIGSIFIWKACLAPSMRFDIERL